MCCPTMGGGSDRRGEGAQNMPWPACEIAGHTWTCWAPWDPKLGESRPSSLARGSSESKTPLTCVRGFTASMTSLVRRVHSSWSNTRSFARLLIMVILTRWPAAELKLVPMGWSGNHPWVWRMTGPLLELLMWKISNLWPQNLGAWPPSSHRRGTNKSCPDSPVGLCAGRWMSCRPVELVGRWEVCVRGNHKAPRAVGRAPDRRCLMLNWSKYSLWFYWEPEGFPPTTTLCTCIIHWWLIYK